MADEKVYKVGWHSYTLAQVHETAKRHGEDGVLYYPPSLWGKVGGWGEGQVPPTPAQGDVLSETYHKGYQEGREHFKRVIGSYPSTGCDAFDAKG